MFALQVQGKAHVQEKDRYCGIVKEPSITVDEDSQHRIFCIVAAPYFYSSTLNLPHAFPHDVTLRNYYEACAIFLTLSGALSAALLLAMAAEKQDNGPVNN